MRDRELGSILDGQEALVRRNAGDETFGEGRLARARGAGDDNVPPARDGFFQEGSPFAAVAKAHEFLLVRSQVVAGHFDGAKKVPALELVERHRETRNLADGQADFSRRNGGRDDDLAALAIGEDRRDDRIFRCYVLARLSSGGNGAGSAGGER